MNGHRSGRRWERWVSHFGTVSRRRLLAMGATVALTAGLGPFRVVGAEVPPAGGTMFRGNEAKTGEMPGPDVTAPPDVRWRSNAPSGEWLAPAVAGNQVFASRYLGGLSAFDAEKGTLLWDVPAGTYDKFDSSPAVANGLVVTGAGPYTLLAVDAATGAERWRYEAEIDLSDVPVAARDYAKTIYGSFFSSPTIAGDTVYVGVWSATGDGTIGENPANGLYAIELATGRLRWRVPVAHGAISSPAVVAGVVYVVDRLATVYALDASSGQELWSVAVAGVAASSPAVADGIVVVAIRGRPETPGGSLVAFRARTGVVVWRQAAMEPASPAISDGRVYVAARDGTLIALDATAGSQIWTFQAGAALAAPTVVPGGAVHVGSGDGTIYALDSATGTEGWRFTGERAFLSSPTVVGGIAFVGDEGGTLYALE